MYCTKCGKLIPDDTRDCPNCGYELSYESNALRNSPPVRQRRVRKSHIGGVLVMLTALVFLTECVYFFGVEPSRITGSGPAASGGEAVSPAYLDLVPTYTPEEATPAEEEPLIPETEPTATPTVTPKAEAVPEVVTEPVEVAEIRPMEEEVPETAQVYEEPEEVYEEPEEVYEEVPEERDAGGSDGSLPSTSALSEMSASELRIARNEIYARHGLIFQSEDLREYFSNQPWYEGTVSDAGSISLTEEEAALIQQILDYEAALD